MIYLAECRATGPREAQLNWKEFAFKSYSSPRPAQGRSTFRRQRDSRFWIKDLEVYESYTLNYVGPCRNADNRRIGSMRMLWILGIIKGDHYRANGRAPKRCCQILWNIDTSQELVSWIGTQTCPMSPAHFLSDGPKVLNYQGSPFDQMLPGALYIEYCSGAFLNLGRDQPTCYELQFIYLKCPSPT